VGIHGARAHRRGVGPADRNVRATGLALPRMRSVLRMGIRASVPQVRARRAEDLRRPGTAAGWHDPDPGAGASALVVHVSPAWAIGRRTPDAVAARTDWAPCSVVDAPYNRWDRWRVSIGTSAATCGASRHRRCVPNPTGPTQTPPVRQYRRASRLDAPGGCCAPVVRSRPAATTLRQPHSGRL
jgi:hypothetical protein